MKKYIVLSSLLCLAFAFAPTQESKAQSSLISTTNGLARDTVTNTGSKILMLNTVGYKATVGIQVDVLKISGTLAGTLIPVASNDGVTFYAAGAGTMTITDVANQGILFAPPLGYKYYGVKWTGTGTMVGSFVATIITRRLSD